MASTILLCLFLIIAFVLLGYMIEAWSKVSNEFEWLWAGLMWMSLLGGVGLFVRLLAIER